MSLTVLLFASTALSQDVPGGDPPSSGEDGVASTASSSREADHTVVPVFEGWYRNPDGTFSLQFGYFSRSSDEAVAIPLGPDNLIEPARFQGVQPTHFLPRPGDRGPGRGIRHWGVFTVTVPEDFGDREVVWTLRSGGEVHTVPGHIRVPEYELDSPPKRTRGKTYPTVRFAPDEPEGRGPGGIRAEGRSAETGVPLALTVWARGGARGPATLRWFKHQGPGDVTFRRRALEVDEESGKATAIADFDEPGVYVLRVRATNASTEFDRYCCWTNGYVKVTVTGSSASESGNTVESAGMKAAPGRRFLGTAFPDTAATAEAGVVERRSRKGYAGTGEESGTHRPELEPVSDDWGMADELGPPDLILRSAPFDIPARGQDQWRNATTRTGLEEARWVRAVEVRPSRSIGHQAAHHVVVFAESDRGRDLLTEWAPGKRGEVMPSGTGRLLPAGARIGWDVHYRPVGEQVKGDRVQLALWFRSEGRRPEYRSRLRTFRAEPTGTARGANIDIPPGEVREIRGAHRLSSPIRIESFQPHMHRRGAAMSMEAIRPDGRKVVLCRVDSFRHDHHAVYRFPEGAMPILPAGTRLVFTARHDNRSENPRNPDPEQWVGFGRRTVDEMAHAWVAFTRLSAEQYDDLAEGREVERTGANGKTPACVVEDR